MIRTLKICLALLLVTVAVAPSLARAEEEDLLSSIYTENGFEIRRDDRIFALFAALNAAGYDKAEPTRTLPFPRYAWHPLRTKVRGQLSASTEKVKPAIDQYLDAHQQPIEAYLAAALTLSPSAPFTTGAELPKALSGLDKLLTEVSEGAKLPKISKVDAQDFRELLKKLRDPVDAPFAALRKTYRLNEESAPALVLVPNPLDGPENAIARKTADNMHVVVFGLSAGEKELDLKPAQKAYSALLAAEAAEGVTAEGLSTAAEKLHADGVLSRDVTESLLVRQSLQAAVEAKLWAKDAAGAAEESFRHGLVFAPEFLKALDEPAESFPADKGSFARQVVARVNLDKTLTQLARGSTIKK
jgi:hypothetical protein